MRKTAIPTLALMLTAALSIGAPTTARGQQSGSACYTANCTGTDITNKRKCYLCCADKCSENGNQTTDCQEQCDLAHPKLMMEARPMTTPAALRGGMPTTEAGKLAVLMSDDALVWALEDGTVTDATIEFVDWFIVGGSDQVQRWGLISLSWFIMEHPTTPEARKAVREILFAELDQNPDPKIRRLVLGVLAEARMWYDSPESTRRIIKAIRDDESPLVRSQGVGLLSHR